MDSNHPQNQKGRRQRGIRRKVRSEAVWSRMRKEIGDMQAESIRFCVYITSLANEHKKEQNHYLFSYLDTTHTLVDETNGTA
jgi:hypothetical protein